MLMQGKLSTGWYEISEKIYINLKLLPVIIPGWMSSYKEETFPLPPATYTLQTVN